MSLLAHLSSLRPIADRPIPISLVDNFSHMPNMPKLMKVLRISMAAPFALLITGGSLIAVDFPLARKLEVAGYGCFAAILFVLVAIEVYLFTMKRTLVASSRKVGGSRENPQTAEW